MLLVIIILFSTNCCLKLLQEPVAIEFLPAIVFFGIMFLITFCIKIFLRKRVLNYLEVKENDDIDGDPIWHYSPAAYLTSFLYCGSIIYLLCVMVKCIDTGIPLASKLIMPLLIIGGIEILFFISMIKTMKNRILPTILSICYLQAWILNKGIALIAIVIGYISIVELAICGICFFVASIFGSPMDD